MKVLLLVSTVAALMLSAQGDAPRTIPAPRFAAAQPVWLGGREREKNLTVGFHAAVATPDARTVTLRLTASTLYRCYVDGQLAGHGPARAGHGYYRVDEWDISRWLKPGTNVIAIEVAGYNANSYYLLDQPSFLQAEVVADGRVVAATGSASVPFHARVIDARVQKAQRYSFQRPFTDTWRLAPGWDAWRTRPDLLSAPSLPLVMTSPKALLSRGLPLPELHAVQPSQLAAEGRMERGTPPEKPWRDRALTDIGPKLGGYPESELGVVPTLELQAWRTTSLQPRSDAWSNVLPRTLGAGGFLTADLGINLTGFLGLDVEVLEPTRLHIVFDEILRDGDVDWKRLGCANIVALDLEPGAVRFETFEPYTLRYAKIIALTGSVRVTRLYLRELANPDVHRAHFASSDPRLNRLFDAGRQTYRQNAFDVFMDCPSRERAGWLCDSYFTARVSPRLSGNTQLERNFLENFALPATFEHLPEGMLPMCYPADHHDGVFIPNWAMWFVLQLEEYADRSGDTALVKALEARVLRLLQYLATLRNDDGLLEKLPGWVFVEWSKANDWVQDVNFPSNMLYAKALAVAGRLYNRPELTREAEALRHTLRRLAFDGSFFIDNAVRRAGRLEVTKNRSEVAQYFAFYFDVATPESHPGLWQVLRTDFGPQRRTTGAHPDIAPANAFVGNVLRLELLSRYGLSRQVLDESVGYLLYMADKTGTLWENDGDYASCNHGFASHVVNVLYRDVLGLHTVDPVNRQVTVRFSDVQLDWCEGSVPVGDGRIALRWNRSTGGGTYRLELPEGWRASVAHPEGERWTQ